MVGNPVRRSASPVHYKWENEHMRSNEAELVEGGGLVVVRKNGNGVAEGTNPQRHRVVECGELNSEWDGKKRTNPPATKAQPSYARPTTSRKASLAERKKQSQPQPKAKPQSHPKPQTQSLWDSAIINYINAEEADRKAIHEEEQIYLFRITIQRMRGIDFLAITDPTINRAHTPEMPVVREQRERKESLFMDINTQGVHGIPRSLNRQRTPELPVVPFEHMLLPHDHDHAEFLDVEKRTVRSTPSVVRHQVSPPSNVSPGAFVDLDPLHKPPPLKVWDKESLHSLWTRSSVSPVKAPPAGPPPPQQHIRARDRRSLKRLADQHPAHFNQAVSYI
eukprot:TRINITY_DN4595_c0_g1_i1.p1 TRINITY_DN4595_c0_g1~~TRINITY_DN4595_c0_g1_i1.p1  ORF type:complete len:335 (+),score=46.29 TRINITY_DN4595_c0_g1_i1:98-1102(+)